MKLQKATFKLCSDGSTCRVAQQSRPALLANRLLSKAVTSDGIARWPAGLLAGLHGDRLAFGYPSAISAAAKSGILAFRLLRQAP